MDQPAVCEINKCGVLAIGRCWSCKRAFCPTHQGWKYSSGSRFTDACGECINAQKAQAEKQSLILFERDQALRDRIRVVIKSLVEAGKPGIITRRAKVVTYKRKSFSSEYRPVEKIADIESAWPVGKFLWRKDVYLYEHFYERFFNLNTGITANEELVELGNPPDFALDSEANQIPIDEKPVENAKRAIDSHVHALKDLYQTEILDSIRIELEKIAAKHGVKLEPYQWPPASVV
jgi:hypothetical protein